MRDASIEQLGLEYAQRGRHRLETLADLDEVRLDLLLVETNFEQPALQIGEVPAVESDRPDFIFIKQTAQPKRDVLVVDRSTRHDLDVSLLGPQVIRDAIAFGPLAQSILGQPERRMGLPDVADLADQHASREIVDSR